MEQGNKNSSKERQDDEEKGRNKKWRERGQGFFSPLVFAPYQNSDLFTGCLTPLCRGKEGSAGTMSLEFGNNHFSQVKILTTCHCPVRTSSYSPSLHAHEFIHFFQHHISSHTFFHLHPPPPPVITTLLSMSTLWKDKWQHVFLWWEWGERNGTGKRERERDWLTHTFGALSLIAGGGGTYSNIGFDFCCMEGWFFPPSSRRKRNIPMITCTWW